MKTRNTSYIILKKIILVFFLLLNSQIKSQTTYAKFDPFTNPVILSHYTVIELQNYQINDTAKFNAIVYYYTQSFIVEPLICDECPAFDPATFDVSKYEYIRKKSERYIRDFYKYGFKITMLSVDELKYKLPIHQQ
jgi:hypothetical protein